MMQKNKEIIFNRLYYWLFLALALFIPLWKPVVPYIIGLIVLSWFLQLDFREKYVRIKSEPFRIYILSFALFYLLHWIGLIYTSNLDTGLFKLEVKLSLLIFPLLISTMPSRVFKSRNVFYIFMMFILGCLLASVIDLVIATKQYLVTKDTGVFYYSRLSFFHHTAYFSMYLTMAVAIMIFLLLKKDSRLHRFHKVAFVFLIIYFSVFIILLSSKAGIISLVLLYFITIGYFLVIERKVVQSLALILIITALFYATLRVFPYSLNRIITSVETLENFEDLDKHKPGSTGMRILIWSSTMEIIGEHFLTGVGTGDVDMHLQKIYREQEIEIAHLHQYNAHSQFLQTFMGLGISGFLMLILMLVLPAAFALRQQSFLYFVFLIVFIVNLLVESMIETQAGVVYYAFFNALFLFSMKNNQNSQ